jgi:hypothetical protein
LGHRPFNTPSAHERQNVHSKEQISASVASGARSRSQHSQFGRSWSIGLSSGQVHLCEHRAPQETVRIREGLDDLEVVVALADEELHGLAGCLHRRGEVARLALELRRPNVPWATMTGR